MDDFESMNNKDDFVNQDLPEYNLPYDYTAHSASDSFNQIPQQPQYAYNPQYFYQPEVRKTAYTCSLISFACGISVVASLLLYIIYIIMELSSLHVPDSLMLSVFGWLLAIVTFVCPIPSLVFGIIGLVKSGQKTIEYNANKARLFSIIGIVSFGICLIMFLIIVALAFIGLNAVYSSYV